MGYKSIEKQKNILLKTLLPICHDKPFNIESVIVLKNKC